MWTTIPRTGPWTWGLLLGAVLAGYVDAADTAKNAQPPDQRDLARQILHATGVKGGLIVHLGCGDGKLTAALSNGDGYLVHGLDADAGKVREARKHVRSLGLYGKVSIERLLGKRLPYTDNLVNLVVSEDLGGVTAEELTRVLCPNGVAYVRHRGKWTTSVKPRPEEIDDWTHCLHGPDGNAVGRDSVVGPPYHIQWVGEPRSARQHERFASVSAVVSAGGRVFSIQDEGPTASVVLPARWFLVARDAFNGVILWKRPVAPWEDHLRDFRMGPADIARRLVAVGDRVYVTLGYGKPVTALDAATGQTARTYQHTDGTSEILYCDGLLLLAAGDVGGQEAARAAKRRGASSAAGDKRILAVRSDNGELLWQKADARTARLMPTTLAAGGGRVFLQNSEAVLCLDAESGRELWRAARPVAVSRPDWSTPTLVVYGEVVLSADRAAPNEVKNAPGRKHQAHWVDAPRGELIALSAETGERLWSRPCREGFNAPVDVLVAGGLVWSGKLVTALDPGITVGLDPITGEVKRRRPTDDAFFKVGMAHHRCYRNRATDRYLVLGRAGVEFVDLESGRALANHWVRGTCQFGVVPCNGLLYVPPHSCACYPRAKLNGFCALAPKRLSKPVVQGARLRRGSAFGKAPLATTAKETDWPTYRCDAARSGFTSCPVAADLQPAWQADPGGRLSSIVVAGGKVFVASVDDHTVHALDAATGKTVWQRTAGGRVDSPPTIYKGLALFGSADGSVYCLRAADGALLWQFRAGEDRRVVSYGQLESVWPVHGSVLIQDGVACCAAGRSSYLDGGIYLYRLDPATGKQLSVTRINSRDAETDLQPLGAIRGFEMPGALPDVLSSDGTFMYMRQMKFDRQGGRQEQGGVHLFAPTGFLDDTWWHRSYWTLGTTFHGGYRDWFRAGREVPAGRLLVFDRSSVYGFGRKPEYFYWSTPLQYHLFAADKQAKVVPTAKKRGRMPAWGQHQIEYDWSRSLPFHVRAMVLADKTLFVAGPPDVLDEEKAFPATSDAEILAKLAEQNDALEGRKGAVLWAVSTSDGKRLSQYTLDSPPVFDGMAATEGRLYISTISGKVLCFRGR